MRPGIHVNRSTARILLVEDEAVIALSEKQTIERHGFEVVLAHSGEAAVEAAINRSGVDLVLMDIDLGRGIDGTEAARRILDTRELPIVFLTSHREKAYVDRVREITSYGYVLKDSGEFVLLETIRLALELYRAHREREQSRQLYRSIAHSTGEIITRVDERNRWIFINKEGQRVWGMSFEEAMFRPFMEFVHPEDREATRQTDRKLRQRKEPVFGFANRQWTTMGWRTYEWNTFPIVDEFGEYRGHQATGRDVTARVEAERRLQRLTERYTHAERAAGLGHWEMDVETGHSTWSDELFRICGFEPQSFTPTAETGFGLIHPDDRDTARDRVNHTLETGEPYRIEKRIVRPSGEVRWIDSRGSLVYDAERERATLVGSFLDITDRKNVEQELQSALQERDLLMSELNHRVKNNLSLVASLISLKQDALGETVDLSDIARQIGAIRSIHEELQMSPHVDRIEFAPYLRDLVTRAMPSASGTGVHIDIDVGERTLPSRTATTLGLIVNELASNAVEHGFTPGAENRFSLSFDTDDDARECVLVVSNSGTAFPEEVDLREPPTLGLQLVRALTEQLHGSIRLERSPHPVFTIRFPLGAG